MSGRGEHLCASDLLLSVYSFDKGLVLHTLNGAVDVRSLLQFARGARNGKRKPANHVLRLARALAPAYMPVTLAQLLAALLLDGNNEIAEYLRNQNVSVWKIVERQLQHTLSSPFFFGADESEMKARTWLLQLIPEQGCAYISSGTIEIASSLFPGRVYKIYGDRHTEIFENQRLVADVCIYLEDPSLPETDRVIAEYFLLRGDEKAYLRTANVFRCI
jgi:hypothetical protein